MDLLSGSAGVVMDRDSWVTYKRYIDFECYHELLLNELIHASATQLLRIDNMLTLYISS